MFINSKHYILCAVSYSLDSTFMRLKNVSPTDTEIKTILRAAIKVLELRWCNEPFAVQVTPA